MSSISVDTSLTSYIDENNCIGCAKCTKACPNDAIIGSKNLIHVVIEQWCASCGDCLAVCPTDCISMVTKRFAGIEPVENFAKKITQNICHQKDENYFDIEETNKTIILEELEVFLNEENNN